VTALVRRPLVLVVDDHQDSRDAAAQGLSYYGFRVETAADGEEALRKAAGLLPEVVVMDLAMPVVDGWTATATLKSNPYLRHISVIVVTAHAMPGEAERAFAAGCDRFMVKPVGPEALAEAVAKACAARPARTA
jgi:two-component system, cell cycle response regulator DivK